jgi:hypothetical protein
MLPGTQPPLGQSASRWHGAPGALPTQRPAAHAPLAGHAIPHAPQLPRWVARSTQAVPQAVSPGPHTQLPDEHVMPVGHAMSHAPQCRLSDEVSTHEPLHMRRGSVQPLTSVHTPVRHTCDALQTRPQRPQ